MTSRSEPKQSIQESPDALVPRRGIFGVSPSAPRRARVGTFAIAAAGWGSYYLKIHSLMGIGCPCDFLFIESKLATRFLFFLEHPPSLIKRKLKKFIKIFLRNYMKKLINQFIVDPCVFARLQPIIIKAFYKLLDSLLTNLRTWFTENYV